MRQALSSSLVQPLALAVVTSTLLCIGYKLVFASKNEKLLVNEGETVIELLEGEREGMVHAPSINTITFFKGHISDVDLSLRVNDIVAQNPWLDSKLVTLKNRGGLCAVYNSASPTRFRHFEVNRDVSVSTESAYNDIMNKIDPLLVKMGRQSADREEPVFKVCLIEMKERKECALIVSLSHVIGDGHTFYKIYSMLNPSSKVCSLESTRNRSFMTQLDRVQGPHINNWLRTPTTIIGFILNAVARKAPYMGVFEVNMEAVENMKADVLSRATITAVTPKFLSTNDILTSFFYRIFESDYLMMCLNYRNRIEGFTDGMSGNYESVLVYDPSEAASPVALRESLARGGSKSGAVPTMWQSLRSNISASTNWSTFYEEVNFPHANQIIHLPVVKSADAIFRDTLIIFRKSKESLGILYAGRKFNCQSFKVATAGVLGQQCLPDC
jgi:hypothetical protein